MDTRVATRATTHAAAYAAAYAAAHVAAHVAVRVAACVAVRVAAWGLPRLTASWWELVISTAAAAVAMRWIGGG